MYMYVVEKLFKMDEYTEDRIPPLCFFNYPEQVVGFLYSSLKKFLKIIFSSPF